MSARRVLPTLLASRPPSATPLPLLHDARAKCTSKAVLRRYKPSRGAILSGGIVVRQHARMLHTTLAQHLPPAAPKSRDRGPQSEEDTQTDFAAMNILSNTPIPTTAVDACMDDGFALDSGLKVTGAGVLLLGGEAFKWRPWICDGRAEGINAASGKLQNAKGQWEVGKDAWGILDLVWPKPDLLILGTGSKMIPISPQTRQHINDLGVRVEIQDTRNAAAQFNLLATERGVQQIAAALVPIGWREAR